MNKKSENSSSQEIVEHYKEDSDEESQKFNSDEEDKESQSDKDEEFNYYIEEEGSNDRNSCFHKSCLFQKEFANIRTKKNYKQGVSESEFLNKMNKLSF